MTLKEKDEEVHALPKALNAKKKDLSEWYHQVLFFADILDIRYNLKGMNVWKSYGYATMLALKRKVDEIFQKNGCMEMYFPQIVPVEYCQQNPEWWEGFKAEGFKVIAGEKNEVQGALRPTGEPAMYPMYALWIRSHNDLPFRGYETVSSFRYETAHTRPLIRDREITVWHELHTCHASQQEAVDEAHKHIDYYKELWKFAANTPLIVEKPAWELFPGAVGGIEFYNITPNGKAMENGSINILGQAYAKKFKITYKDKEGKEQHVWQVCTGNGARLLAGLIIQHGDDKGLILPPSIAPYQAVIVPIFNEKQRQEILHKANDIKEMLEKAGIRVHLDDRDASAGSKFYDWEIKGVPLRIELGPKDVENNHAIIVDRMTGKKHTTSYPDILKFAQESLKTMHAQLLAKSEEELHERIAFADSLKKMAEVLDHGKCAKVHWCKDGKCYDEIKTVREGAEIFGSEYYEKKKGKCVVCDKETDNLAYCAKTY
jgi:prolyl-tRNA synthetase